MKPFDGYFDQSAVPGLIAKILNGSPNARLPRHVGTSLLEDPKSDKGNYGKAMRLAKPYFRMFLRGYVDQWIDSGHGFSSTAADIPKERSIFAKSPQGIVLANRITEWLKENPAKIGLLSGHVDIRGELPDQPPLYFQYNPPQLNESLSTEQGAAKWGRDLAIYYLIRLIASPAQKRLARCCVCLKYFVYRRAPAQRNETRCESCNDSRQRTKSSRDKKKAQMLDSAANAWNKWRKSERAPDQREWVALRVNEKFGTELTRKWVSQNMAGIQKRVEALRNAKG